MTTVKQLIEWLQRQPPDAKIEVLEEYQIGLDTLTEWVDLKLDDYTGNVDILDFTKDVGTKHDGEVFIRFGEK